VPESRIRAKKRIGIYFFFGVFLTVFFFIAFFLAAMELHPLPVIKIGKASAPRTKVLPAGLLCRATRTFSVEKDAGTNGEPACREASPAQGIAP
jgi:hypothetical protein